MLAACGNDNSGSGDTSSQTDSAETRPGYGAKPADDESAPESADDNRPPAPDDKISNRPGGPNDKSGISPESPK